MKKAVLFIFLMVCFSTFYGQKAINYYVSNNGNDSSNPGTFTSNFKTLKKAHDVIQSSYNPLYTYNVILIGTYGEINVTSNGYTLLWTISGNENNPINIYSYGNERAILNQKDGSSKELLKIEANYINIKRIHFKSITNGAIWFEAANNCSVDYCVFDGENELPYCRHIIWIGYNGLDKEKWSYNNIVSNNLFKNISTVVCDTPTANEQIIYFSLFSKYNEAYNNSIISPPAYGIQFWHGYSNNNIASRNIIQQIDNICDFRGIALGCESSGTVCNSFPYDNTIAENFIFDINNNDAVYLPQGEGTNEIYGNYVSSTYYPHDPYWLAYDPNKITDRVVSGDFDRDGKDDDIAAFYDYGNNVTKIHVWKKSDDSNAFIYSASNGWWSSTSYNASKITGRVVSGDFDRDGYKDDIAAFYDYGNGETRIHVWKSTGSSFVYQYSTGWWSSPAYTATRITNRVISGDFDRDGKEDDIAAFYDYGNGVSKIHVWKSTGSSFSYQHWWSNDHYNANNITGRVVSGDFNRDGKKDDIAAFYNSGNNITNLHVWKSNSSSFSFQGSTLGWWNSNNYDAASITGRVISGDFNSDGKKDDIVAFYDHGNNQTTMHVWKSLVSSFHYFGDSGWWNVGGYNSNELTGRVIVGDFDRDGVCDDISGFYNYSSLNGSLRSHVWQGVNSSFIYKNGSLGFPWLSTFSYFINTSRDSKVYENEFTRDENNSKGQNIIDEQIVEIKPNPFNDFFTISISLLEESKINVDLYSITGKKIENIFNGILCKGSHNVYSNYYKNRLSNGIYIIKISINEKIITKKVVFTE